MSFFDWIAKIFSEYWRSFLRGTGNTLLMAIIGTIAGFLIGLIIAIIRTVPVKDGDSGVKKAALKIVNTILSVYVEVIRGTPMMVQALIIHYSLFVPLGMKPMASAIIIISVNTGAYMAEIVRGGIISVDKGQFEGAHAIGMSHFKTMFYVILPQAIRNIMPSIGNEFVVNIKDSSVLSVISITELMFAAKQADLFHSHVHRHKNSPSPRKEDGRRRLICRLRLADRFQIADKCSRGGKMIWL